jgi:predicted DNA-binding protein
VDIGNKMEKKRKYEVRIRLTKEEMERIEKVAKKLNMPKARLIRNLALVGLQDAELFAKLGLFDLVKSIEKIKEKALKNNENLLNKELKTN